VRFLLLLVLCAGPGFQAWGQAATPPQGHMSSPDALFGILRMPVGRDAAVERHATVRDKVIEAVIRGVPGDLNAVITGRNNPYVAAMDAVYVGGGTWIVKALMTSAEWDLRISVESGYLLIEVVEGMGDVAVGDDSALTVKALVEGGAPPEAPDQEYPILMFLHGNAMSHGMRSDDFVPLLPVPAALPRASWYAIDRTRTAMLYAQTEVAKAQTRYELGWLYLEKGFSREARYYFELLADNPGALRPVDIALARARADLACHRWDEAREHLRAAYRYGARESAIVEGLGVVSLETGVPGRALTAQVMTRVTGRPEALLLAAELLQRDGYYAESRPMLEALVGRVEGQTAQRVALRLGDARLMAGERDAAVRAYRDAPKKLGEFRVLMVELLEKGPAEWAASVPQFSVMSKEKGEVGAEALYLLSQIDTILGTQVDAIADLSQLIRRHREIAQASDVPERMWAVYKERQRMLIAQEKWFDSAALHEGAWHPVVRRAVKDPTILINVVKAYEKTGLPNRALHLSREIFPMLLRAGVDDTNLVIDLARLYGEAGYPKDGLKTLKYLRSRKVPPGRRAEVAMLAAQMRESEGDATGTARELRRAATDPRYRDEAMAWLGRMDAESGRCKIAIPVLWAKLMSAKGRTQFTESRPYLALARCLAAEGDGVRAASAAKAAAGRSDSREEARYATYLAAMATEWQDGMVRDSLASGDDIWAALSKDHDRAQAFVLELDKRRVTDIYAQ